jgi:GntR family transcriptional regulator/MocR family aminotransferase
MAKGHFARHLRQMGKLYQQRRDLLLAALTDQLGDKVTIGPAQCGMHLTIRFNNGIREAQVREQLNLMGISTNMVGDSALGQLNYQGIMLGFASASSETIKREVAVLSQAIQQAEKELP